MAENFRNLQVRRDRAYEDFPVQHLLDQNMFRHGKDLMVFASLVGLSEGRRKPLGKNTLQIFMHVYQSDSMDGFIYLAALAEKKDIECITNENVRESVQIFEEYCNGGLEIIKSWLEDTPTDVSGLDTIFDKVSEKLIDKHTSVAVNNETLEIELD